MLLTILGAMEVSENGWWSQLENLVEKWSKECGAMDLAASAENIIVAMMHE
jgi:3-oxoacid CoA-transferase subunit B